MPANPTLWEPTQAERRAFGALAEDVAFLRRGCGVIVAPFKGGFRIGDGAATDVVDAAGIRAVATKERDRRTSGKPAVVIARPAPQKSNPFQSTEKAAPVPTKVSAPPEPKCGCGRPNSHQGRCWARRGWPGPSANKVRRPMLAHVEALEAAVAELRAKLEARA